jgi:hypothetical protein
VAVVPGALYTMAAPLADGHLPPFTPFRLDVFWACDIVRSRGAYVRLHCRANDSGIFVSVNIAGKMLPLFVPSGASELVLRC